MHSDAVEEHHAIYEFSFFQVDRSCPWKAQGEMAALVIDIQDGTGEDSLSGSKLLAQDSWMSFCPFGPEQEPESWGEKRDIRGAPTPSNMLIIQFPQSLDLST